MVDIDSLEMTGIPKTVISGFVLDDMYVTTSQVEFSSPLFLGTLIVYDGISYSIDGVSVDEDDESKVVVSGFGY